MRATMRITWLLLSLCCVCSNVDGQTVTSVTKNDAAVSPGPSTVLTGGSTSSAQPTTDSKTTVPVGGTTGASLTGGTGNKNVPTQAPTTAKPTAVAATLAITVPTTSNKPTPTQPQATTVTKNPAAPLTSISGAQSTVRNDPTPTATPSLPNASPPAATVGSTVLPSRATTLQTPAAPVPSETSRTVAPVSLPGEATKIPKVSTDTSTPGQQSLTHTTSTTNTSKDNKAVVMTTNMMVISQAQTTTRSADPAGNTGTSSAPSTATKAGAHAAETSGTKAATTSLQTTTTTTTVVTTSTAAQPKTFLYSLNMGHEEKEEKDLVEVCRRLMVNLQDGNCTLTWQHHNGKIQFDCVEINGKVKTNIATQYYEEITKKPTDNKTLIAILASCGALLIMIVILAVCASHHRKPFNENQQHLTEELHTVENGYHDNPTLEVMEVQPEMQEKKMALNGEFNDSWIVPIDNLLKEDIADEEDTHL